MSRDVRIRAILRHLDAGAATAQDAAALITALEAAVDLFEGLNDYLWVKHGRDAISTVLSTPPRPYASPAQLDLFRPYNNR